MAPSGRITSARRALNFGLVSVPKIRNTLTRTLTNDLGTQIWVPLAKIEKMFKNAFEKLQKRMSNEVTKGYPEPPKRYPKSTQNVSEGTQMRFWSDFLQFWRKRGSHCC